ncbi:MAG TPA: hypothetical protein VJ970_08255 [Flavobacteriaceae bacterium]|nr:hypothetical protein [Flavobacteriaceae bacterium]
MKIFYSTLFSFLFLLISCNSNQNNNEFIETYQGRYLYNSNEVLEVYFVENELFMKWRGADNIKPLKTSENEFFVKEMNEKVKFVTHKNNGLKYISIVPKTDTTSVLKSFKKLADTVKTPSEYFNNKQYNKALNAYLLIKEQDSLDPNINENHLNRMGYRYLRDDKYNLALEIFKINVALYPYSSNVYDSLGEAYLKQGDSAKAVINYKKSLSLDSGNKRAKRIIKEVETKSD